MGHRTSTAERLRRLLEERLPPRILDVRSAAEFEKHHLPGATHIPLEDLETRAGELDPMVDLFVVSEHGIRSLRACERLFGRGYLKVVNIVGGMSEMRAP